MLDVIISKYPQEQDKLRVYAIGDTHVGSEQFNEKAVKKKIQIIRDDPFSALCLCGDLGDYGLRTGKSPTNPYRATMQPQEQIEYIYDLFYPVKDKIVAAVGGNHEERIIRETGVDPMLQLCVLWGKPDIYREEVAINKYIFGSIKKGGKQQNIFIGITSHGSTRNKHHKFAASFDGVDFSISAHTHRPEYSPLARIRIDRIHGTAEQVPFKEIVVDANLDVGGYGLKHEYEIPAPPELQYLELSTIRENDRNRTLKRIMTYHTIAI